VTADHVRTICPAICPTRSKIGPDLIERAFPLGLEPKLALRDRERAFDRSLSYIARQSVLASLRLIVTSEMLDGRPFGQRRRQLGSQVGVLFRSEYDATINDGQNR